LKESLIYMHDLDVATDCQYVTTRDTLQEYLERNIPDVEIKDDRRKVGNHCLSWFSTTSKDQKIRCKVYNKLIQMLESAEVRKPLGSRMEDLVANPEKAFTSRLLDARDKGLSRLEITFYGHKVRGYKYYARTIDITKELLKDCPTYKVSHDDYWRHMVSKIPAMIGVYIPGRNVFAYCHWWNSVTGKMYGSHRGNIGREEAMTLLANYAFNDRPIYYVEVDDDGASTTISKYMRAQGSTAITLVAGGHKGLYPYIYSNDVLKFADVGIVSHENITIAWPKRRRRKGAGPLASIVLQDDSDEGYIRVHYTPVQVSGYRAGYVVLEVGKEYTIVEIALHEYRGKATIFAMTACGIRVRCGSNLAAVVESWLDKYPEGEAPYLTVKVLRKCKVMGVWDITVSSF
ncbi:hypothetical protein BGZ73_001490, partial [Actinomortierella ambigua]